MFNSIFKWIGVCTVLVGLLSLIVFKVLPTLRDSTKENYTSNFRSSFIESCSKNNSIMEEPCACMLDEMFGSKIIKSDASDALLVSTIKEYSQSDAGKQMISGCIKRSLAAAKGAKQIEKSTFYAINGCRGDLTRGKEFEVGIVTEVAGSREDCKKIEADKRTLLTQGGFQCDEIKEKESCQPEGPFADWMKAAEKGTRLGYTYLYSKDLSNRNTVQVFFNKGQGAMALCEYFNSQIALTGIKGKCVEGM
jgi:hypothetical protein